MSSDHTISIAAARQGERRRATDDAVSIPVGELLSSNGLVTGQSGADPADSVRRIGQSLLDAGETLIVVDPAGAYEALADHASALHVGGDRHCDVDVDPTAVDRLASLAIDGSTSIVLDLQAFDAGDADDLLAGLTDALVDARRDRPEDLLLVVGECHRWLAEDGPATRSGENLVQLGGRRHDGVGVVGVTDQPADVREAVLGGVDWVLAHRLTWREDVRALERLLDREYTDALEDLADDEAFFAAGWERDVERLAFGRDVERDEPTSLARSAGTDDLLADVPQATPPAERDQEDDVTDARSRNTGPLAEDHEATDLREDLADIDERLASLESKLDEREDVEAMADRIADAITDGLRGVEVEPAAAEGRSGEGVDDEPSRGTDRAGSADETENDASTDGATDATGSDDGPGDFGDVFGMFDDNDTVETPDSGGRDASTDDGAVASDSSPAASDVPDSADSTPSRSESGRGGTAGSGDREDRGDDAGGGGMSFKPIDFGFDEPSRAMDSTVPDDFGPPSRRAESGRSIPRYLRKIVRSIEEMDETTLKMLGFYIDEGTESPMDAHFSAGGGGDRTRAYAHNRQLRTNGLIEHVGKGKYAPRLREYVVDRAGHSVPEHELDRAVRIIEQTVEAA